MRGRDGKLRNEIVIPRGAVVFSHFQASNVNKALWGEDAGDWKPERWLASLPEVLEEAHIPGVYSNLCVQSHRLQARIVIDLTAMAG